MTNYVAICLTLTIYADGDVAGYTHTLCGIKSLSFTPINHMTPNQKNHFKHSMAHLLLQGGKLDVTRNSCATEYKIRYYENT